jgi:hypothetical protein
VTLLPKTTLGREAEIVTVCGDAAVPTLASSAASPAVTRPTSVLLIGDPFHR